MYLSHSVEIKIKTKRLGFSIYSSIACQYKKVLPALNYP